MKKFISISVFMLFVIGCNEEPKYAIRPITKSNIQESIGAMDAVGYLPDNSAISNNDFADIIKDADSIAVDYDSLGIEKYVKKITILGTDSFEEMYIQSHILTSLHETPYAETVSYKDLDGNVHLVSAQDAIVPQINSFLASAAFTH